MRYSTAVQPHEDLDLVVFLSKIQLCTVCVAVKVKQRVDRHGADLCAAKFHVRCCDAFFSFQRMRPPSHAGQQSNTSERPTPTRFSNGRFTTAAGKPVGAAALHESLFRMHQR